MYEQHLTAKSIFFSWQTFWLFFLFFAIRFFSFFLQEAVLIQAVFIFLLVMLLGILYFKNPNWALYLVLIEIFLGGAGHFFEFIGLSIRTILIGFYLFLWLSNHIGQDTWQVKIKMNSNLKKMLLIFLIFIITSLLVGIFRGNAGRDIVQALIPYAFLLLFLPTSHIFENEASQHYLVRCLVVFIMGTALFSLFVFIIYSSDIGVLHDSFYQWYRDVAMGKITDMGNNFFRIVEPEHLLVVPFMLFIASLLMRDEEHHYMWRFLLFSSSIILVLNFSRIYFLALIVGLIILKYKHKFQRWLIISTTTILFTTLIFFTISLLASGGHSLGLELFGLRVNSLTQPQIEISAATRMMILPSLIEKIQNNWLLGTGLGSTITFFNSTTYEEITTRQFDWGYLQIWIELGLFGLFSFLSLFFFGIYLLINKIRSFADYQDFNVGFLAGLIAFLIINITSPALFHIFGIIYLVFIVTIVSKQSTEIYEKTINLIYQIFHKLKT